MPSLLCPSDSRHGTLQEEQSEGPFAQDSLLGTTGFGSALPWVVVSGLAAATCSLLVTHCIQGSCGEVEGTLGVTGPALNCHSDARSACHCSRAGMGGE